MRTLLFCYGQRPVTNFINIRRWNFSVVKHDNYENRATLYIHWPYCKKICPYCNYNKFFRENIDHTRLTRCFVRETETLIKLSGITEIKSVYFGGGTPSLAEPKTILSILETVKGVATLDAKAEITMETNPTSDEITKLKDFKDAGINRLSIGIQSLCNKDLKFLGRQHTVEESLRCMSEAEKLFHGNFSVDVLFGLPGQTVENLEKEIQKILSFCGHHVSLYQLTMERGTQLFRWVQNGSIVLPDEEVMADLFEVAIQKLEENGYIQYEVSNFALKGRECRHNKSYWEGEQYIGVGPGAHGRFVPKSLGRYQREARVQISDPDLWMTAVESNRHGTSVAQQQSQLEQLEELLITGLGTKDGIQNEHWRRISKKSLDDLFYSQDRVQQFMASGLVEFDDSGMKVSKKGLVVLNSILPDLLNILGDALPGD